MLTKNGSSLVELESLAGMNKTKIELLYQYTTDVCILLEKGFKITDFAGIEEAILRSSFEKGVINSTTTDELFAQSEARNYSPRIFTAHSKNRPEENLCSFPSKIVPC